MQNISVIHRTLGRINPEKFVPLKGYSKTGKTLITDETTDELPVKLVVDESNESPPPNIFGNEYIVSPDIINDEKLKASIMFYNRVLDLSNRKLQGFKVKYIKNKYGTDLQRLVLPVIIFYEGDTQSKILHAFAFTHSKRKSQASEFKNISRFIQAVAKWNLESVELKYEDVNEYITSEEYNKLDVDIVKKARDKSKDLYVLSHEPAEPV